MVIPSNEDWTSVDIAILKDDLENSQRMATFTNLQQLGLLNTDYKPRN